jgi:DNA-binding CsgD family transcriptional regulator
MTQSVNWFPGERSFKCRQKIKNKIPLGCFLIGLLSLQICSYASKKEFTLKDSVEIQKDLKFARQYVHTNFDSALTVALHALNLAKETQYKKGINDANAVLGYIYSIGERWHTPKERELLAQQISRQLNSNRSLSTVLIDIADDYYRFTLKKHAADAMESSAHIAELENNYQNQAYALIRKGEILGEIGKIDSCREAYSRAFALLIKRKDSVLLSQCYISKGKTEMALGNYSMSIENFTNAEELVRRTDQAKLIICYLGIAQNYLYLQQHLKAVKYIETCEQSPLINKNLQLKSQLLLVQSQYLEKFDERQALDKYKEYVQYRDSLYLINEISYITRMRSYFNSQKKEEEIEEIRQEVDLERIKRRTFLIVSLILGGVVIASIFGVRKRNKILARENEVAHERLRLDQERLRNLEEKAQIETQREANKKELELIEKENLRQDLERAELERQKLELELDEKHRTLLTSTMQKEQYQEFFTELIDELTQIKGNTDKKELTQSIDKVLNLVKGKINQADDWDKIKLYFEKVHPEFFEKLKTEYPDLSVNELKFCAYTKMNLNGKEISRLLNINPSSVQVSRYRLKRKMGLPEDVNFTDYILQNY